MPTTNQPRMSTPQRTRGGGGGGASGGRSGRTNNGRPAREVIQTWAFDSVGPRKYALQLQKAKNGNPCLRIVEGVPRDDGSFRKFDLTIWSEDFDSLWEALDAVRAYIDANGIRTPPGHHHDPTKRRARHNRE